MNKYICPQCVEEFNALCGPVDTIDLDCEHEVSTNQYFECPECGYRDEKSAFEDVNQYECGVFDEDDYTPSAESGDYSPGNPWDAPGMSIRDFI